MGDLYPRSLSQLDLEGPPDWLGGDLPINMDQVQKSDQKN